VKWSILILTIPERAHLLARLIQCLMPQVSGHKDIEVLVKTFDTKRGIGDNREALRQMASGEYINFIDDDDLVASDYVAQIYALLDGVDYVSFPVQMYTDGEPSWKFTYSLGCPGPYGAMALWRDLSHLHPMRRELSLAVPMEGDRLEDLRWVNRLREEGIVRTEHNIPEPLYHYYYLTRKVEAIQ